MKSKILKILISIGFSVLCVWLVTRNIKWDEVRQIWSQATLGPILLGYSIVLITHIFRGIRWKIILGKFKQVSLFPIVRWLIAALLINNLMPLRMGEVARAYWAGHKTGILKSTLFATIVAERVLDLISIFTIAVVVLFYNGIYHLNASQDSQTIYAGILIFLALSILIKFTLVRINWTSWFKNIEKKFPHQFSGIISNFATGLSVFTNFQEFLKLYALSLLTWCIEIIILAILSRSIGLDLTLAHAGMLLIGLILGIMIPAAPGAAGTFEAGGVTALALVGVSKTLALSFVLMLHTLQFFFVVLLGVPVLLIEGFSFKKIFKIQDSL